MGEYFEVEDANLEMTSNCCDSHQILRIARFPDDSETYELRSCELIPGLGEEKEVR